VGWLNPIFKGVSWIGRSGAVYLVAALLAAVLLRRLNVFLLVAAADLVAGLSADGIKNAIDRSRPTFRPLVAEPTSSSFPSGHAATSFACAAVLAWLMPKLAFPVFVLATAVAYSRVYLGVHYPLDVIGGAALGLVVSTALLLLARALRRSRAGRPAG
jgi:undecaprenyl-diphosphatase